MSQSLIPQTKPATYPHLRCAEVAKRNATHNGETPNGTAAFLSKNGTAFIPAVFDHYGAMGPAIAAFLYGSIAARKVASPHKMFEIGDFEDAGWITKGLEQSDKQGEYHAPYQPSALNGQLRAASEHINAQNSTKEGEKKHYWEAHVEHQIAQSLSRALVEGRSAVLTFYNMAILAQGSGGTKSDEVDFDKIREDLFISAEKKIEEVHAKNFPSITQTTTGMRAKRPTEEGRHSPKLEVDGFDIVSSSDAQERGRASTGEGQIVNDDDASDGASTDHSTSAASAGAGRGGLHGNNEGAEMEVSEAHTNNSSTQGSDEQKIRSKREREEQQEISGGAQREEREHNKEGGTPDQNYSAQEAERAAANGGESTTSERNETHENGGARKHWTETKCRERRDEKLLEGISRLSLKGAAKERESMGDEESTKTKGEHRSLSGGGPESLANWYWYWYWYCSSQSRASFVS